VSVEHAPGASTFAEFAEAIDEYRVRTATVVRNALDRIAGQATSGDPDIANVSREIEGTFRTLDGAAEEIRVQNESLFAASLAVEGMAAVFRDLFELAPVAYVATNLEARVIYANEAACNLLRVPKNALSGKPLACFIPVAERAAFRSNVLRACEASGVTSWPAALVPRGAPRFECRLRVRSASASGGPTARLLYWNITEETDEDLF
jgi:PAS domain-containing protein